MSAAEVFELFDPEGDDSIPNINVAEAFRTLGKFPSDEEVKELLDSYSHTLIHHISHPYPSEMACDDRTTLTTMYHERVPGGPASCIAAVARYPISQPTQYTQHATYIHCTRADALIHTCARDTISRRMI